MFLNQKFSFGLLVLLLLNCNGHKTEYAHSHDGVSHKSSLPMSLPNPLPTLLIQVETNVLAHKNVSTFHGHMHETNVSIEKMSHESHEWMTS